jgi:rare lipoprotein A (peptidoglycan hydrolase)
MYQNGARLRIAACAAVVALVSIGLSGCSSTSKSGGGSAGSHINTKTKFSSDEYGVGASPRVTTEVRPKKGGGRSFVGKPYRVRGKWYTPKEDPNYDKAGLASWYGPNFHGRLTANGEIYDQFHLSAAHPTFPLPSYARVTNKKNGNSVIVRVNDRGPFAHGRIIDLSNKAAQLLDMKHEGVAAVRGPVCRQSAGRGRRHPLPDGKLSARRLRRASGRRHCKRRDAGDECRGPGTARCRFVLLQCRPAGSSGRGFRSLLSVGAGKHAGRLAARHSGRLYPARDRAGASRPAIIRASDRREWPGRHAGRWHGLLGWACDCGTASLRGASFE